MANENEKEKSMEERLDILTGNESHQEEENHGAEEASDTNESKEKKGKSMGREILEWVISIGLAVVLALGIRTFIFTLVLVDGHSMDPTLNHHDRLVVTRLGYEPKDGDIIVFHPACEPQSAYVKRVIATEGETVCIDYNTNTVYVNGVALAEDYIKEPMEYRGPDGEVTVPENCVFVMGDNRNNSKDSRASEVGFVTEESIVGKAQVRLWPLSSIGVVK